MPELAEVEYFRKQWHSGLGEPILGIALHARKRIFRNASVPQLRSLLPRQTLSGSEAYGKQLLFQFTGGLWLGLHLGMTGRLASAPPAFRPGKHDHLVLYQPNRALVFTDPRLFGSVRFAQGAQPPAWWSKPTPPITSKSFTLARVQEFLKRHGKLPIKATLLLQSGFPGIGNWMADEILWRAKVHPLTPSSLLSPDQIGVLWRAIREVSRGALRTVGKDFSDPPSGWLFHERWSRGGRCPAHEIPLVRRTVGGRTTVWCAKCQD